MPALTIHSINQWYKRVTKGLDRYLTCCLCRGRTSQSCSTSGGTVSRCPRPCGAAVSTWKQISGTETLSTRLLLWHEWQSMAGMRVWSDKFSDPIKIAHISVRNVQSRCRIQIKIITCFYLLNLYRYLNLYIFDFMILYVGTSPCQCQQIVTRGLSQLYSDFKPPNKARIRVHIRENSSGLYPDQAKVIRFLGSGSAILVKIQKGKNLFWKKNFFQAKVLLHVT